jgi:hypothetical protein
MTPEEIEKAIQELRKRIQILEDCQCLGCRQRIKDMKDKEEWLILGD